MQQLLERINKLTLAAKLGIIFGIALVLTAGTWYFLISDLQTRIEGLKAEYVAKSNELAEKQEIADNLVERKRELDKAEADFQAALAEMPEQKDIDELLAQLNDVGKKSGLEISKVTPAEETPDKFYSKIPISMTVKGNYHEIAMFLQEVSNMKRIVNVNNIKFVQPSNKNDKVILGADFLATTFRFKEAEKPKAAKSGGQK
jgi:type IV pilus assembly protein PilO